MQSNHNWRNAGGKLALVAGVLCAGALALVFSSGRITRVDAQTGPELLDKHLQLRTIVTGLMVPKTMAFIDDEDIFVQEKTKGQIQRVVDGVIEGEVLDLNVNFGSERGLLGIAVDPQFEINGFVYLYWTASSVMADTNVLSQTPLLGNRVDRYHWNGSTLAFERNLIMLRAIQQDAGHAGPGGQLGGVELLAARDSAGRGPTRARQSRRWSPGFRPGWKALYFCRRPRKTRESAKPSVRTDSCMPGTDCS